MPDHRMNLCSINIRFESTSDGPNNWPNRKDILFKILKLKQPDLFGTQEGRKKQIYDIVESMDEYEIIDGHRKWIEPRMFPSIFVRKNIFNIKGSGDFWLSKFPNISGSRSYNSDFPRLCTWSILEHSKNKEEFAIFCTHLDHQNPDTRLEQAKVLCQQILKILRAEKINKFILLGDFNEGPNGMTRKILAKNLQVFDPWETLGLDNLGTYHRFDGKSQQNERIDWILHSKLFTPQTAEIFQFHDNGKFPSDHHPIFCELNY
jgi:endonuclease/exonuclease/phosphatase family metal-dependent hydrolase